MNREMQTIKRIKTNWLTIVIIFITVASGSFVGFLASRLYPTQPAGVETDTVFIGPSTTDSLLEEISEQVHEINIKIPSRRHVSSRYRMKKDTIRIDASLHIDNGQAR